MARASLLSIVVMGIAIVACGDDATNKSLPHLANKAGTLYSDSVHHDGPTCGPVDASRAPAIPTVAETWSTWSIPEFQDKQRFVAGRADDYGPIACIAARQDLDSVKPDSFQTSGGVVVAVIWVDTGAFNAAYTQLKLRAGFNCVIVKESPVGAPPIPQPIPALGNMVGRVDDRWSGYIVPSVGKVCDPISPSQKLSTIALTADGLADRDYPPVARFMILRSWRAAVGVRCGPRWCVVGAPNSMALPAPAHIGRVAGAAGRVKTMFVIPGWYDEQEVAVPSTAPFGLTATLKASVVADSGLDHYTIAANFDTGFVRVATVHFEDAPTNKYQSNYQFHAESVQPDTLFIMHVTTGTPHWVARVNHSLRYFRVMRTPHPGHVTGTARWSWQEGDEWIWVRCEDGCCLVESDYSDSFASLDLIFRQRRKNGLPG